MIGMCSAIITVDTMLGIKDKNVGQISHSTG